MEGWVRAGSETSPDTRLHHFTVVILFTLQGRESLVVTTKSDPANGSWVYVGHHESYWDEKQKLNPITGKMEWNGTSILDIADPSKPKLVWHIPNETNRNSRDGGL